ncbi:L-threonine ammonia-lyase-like [Liolophura sinensis]|uniref:L-threonine ammonia-lyase-like n=1 Tax=Liolophura sinensis TaxID=3198878 RepID=UPI003158F3CA
MPHYENFFPLQILLKLENLQPIGSFKLRGACNAIEQLSAAELVDGVYTASAGNFAQGLSWNARQRHLPCQVIVPETAPAAKLDAISRLGGIITKVPFDRWWKIIQDKHMEGMMGHFIHPVVDPHVMAGNGTVGLEILEDVHGVDAVLIPYGGGALCAGIATVVKAISPKTKVFACEVETAAPLKAALIAGQVIECDYSRSFVDGIGSKSVLSDMWPIVQDLLDDSLVVSLEQISEAIKLLVERNHIVAEGAGAAPVAAALAGLAGHGKIVCVVSGGNINSGHLIKILQGQLPN